MIRPIDLKDDSVWAMFEACQEGDLALVRKLVAMRRELAVCKYNYEPPLHCAVREGHLDIVQFLLEHGADGVRYRSYPFQETLVTMAQDRGHDEVAACLLERAARLFPLRSGIEGFLKAAGRGDLAGIQGDLARDSGLAGASDEAGDTALHRAVAGGHAAVMNTLLDAGGGGGCSSCGRISADPLRVAGSAGTGGGFVGSRGPLRHLCGGDAGGHGLRACGIGQGFVAE